MTITRDALGRAAETYDGTTYREVAYAPGGGPVGRLSGGSMVEADVPLPGGGAAVYTGSSGPPARYEHADWEGSVRLTTTAAQGVYGTEAYGAFGAEYDGSGTSPVNYTGERQDTVTGAAGLYDFLMREESPTQGRWLNPDPAGMAAVDPGNPQTWNRYAYATNQPTFQTDPTGLLEVDCDWDGCPQSQTWQGGGGAVAAPDYGYGGTAGMLMQQEAADEQQYEAGAGLGDQMVAVWTDIGQGYPGNASPFTFTANPDWGWQYEPAQQSCAWWDARCNFFSGFVNLTLNNQPTGALQMAGAEAEIVASAVVGAAVAPAVTTAVTSGMELAQSSAMSVYTNPDLVEALGQFVDGFNPLGAVPSTKLGLIGLGLGTAYTIYDMWGH